MQWQFELQHNYDNSCNTFFLLVHVCTKIVPRAAVPNISNIFFFLLSGVEGSWLMTSNNGARPLLSSRHPGHSHCAQSVAHPGAAQAQNPHHYKNTLLSSAASSSATAACFSSSSSSSRTAYWVGANYVLYCLTLGINQGNHVRDILGHVWP